jgi:RNA polymerase sigma-70 factor (sigma-E family)
MEQIAVLGEGARVPEVARMTAGASLEEIFDAQYARLCRLARVIVGDPATAEEIVMEAFLRTLVGWRRIRDLSRVEAYLQRAVVNGCRSATRRRVTEQRANAAVGARAAIDSEVGAAERYVAADAVLRAVRELPHRQRAAVVLRFYSDLTEEQTAAALGCSVGTVKSQVAKAKRTLARVLTEGERS